MNKAHELLRKAVKKHPYKKKSGLFTKQDAKLHIQNLAKEGTAEVENMVNHRRNDQIGTVHVHSDGRIDAGLFWFARSVEMKVMAVSCAPST
mmetsp:Transcript_10823/g.23587  ORF Transcript_10823/g.23587 Transcript_10823/m.23587 type:complete len:92 (+) Transcript_10823:75-350(+)